MYYTYNHLSVLTDKSADVPFAENGCQSDLDFDLANNEVVVASLREDGFILRWQCKPRRMTDALDRLRTAAAETQAENTELLSLLGAIEQAEYEKVLEEIDNATI